MKRLQKLLSEILETTEDEIKDELSPAEVETWDSFNGLLIVSGLEDVFNVKLTMDDIISIKNVKDIKNILEKYGVELINK